MYEQLKECLAGNFDEYLISIIGNSISIDKSNGNEINNINDTRLYDFMEQYPNKTVHSLGNVHYYTDGIEEDHSIKPGEEGYIHSDEL